MTRAIVFDWGGTLMREIPMHRRPSVHSPRIELVPGVEDALEELHRQYVCCVASNARGPEATTLGIVMERFGLDQYFQFLFTSQTIGSEKPSASFYKEVLRQLRVDPSECVMVGDDYATDIAGAKAVGMRTVWFTETNPREVPHADVVIHSMGELVDAIAKLDE